MPVLLPLLAVATTAVGILSEPCPPATPLPPEVVAYLRQVYATPAPARLPPQSAAMAAANAAWNAAYQNARKTDWPDLCHYRNDDQKLAKAPPADRRVVFMGDSITELWGYVDPVFYQPGWVNRGISGQTTPQMLLRFHDDVLALHPKVVHIMGGTNDVAGNTGPSSLDTVEGNISGMVTLAKAAGIRVVLAAVPPSAGYKWSSATDVTATIAALNVRLKALAAREKVAFVDYGTVLATPEGALKPEMTFDGTHPDSAGYAVMAPIAKAAVEKALK